MSDYARRVFRVQLASVMDALLKTAVCEIAKIFEGSLCEQQTELMQRADQISALQGRLQEVEGLLRGGAAGALREGAEDHLETVAQLEVYADGESSRQTVSSAVTDNTGAGEDNVPPDDWCAPIQWDEPENPPEVEAECPSVTLRPLRVSLWRIPSLKQDLKHEVEEDFESHLITALSTSPSFKGEEELQSKLRRRIERRLKADPEYDDHVQDGDKDKTEVKTGTLKRKKGNGWTNHNDQTSYNCKYCPRIFQTEAGLKVHTWSHQRCYKCHKTFTSPHLLHQHIRVVHRDKIKNEPKNNNHKFNFAKLLHSCKQCSQRFYTKSLLKEHVENDHEYEPWEDEEEGNGDIVSTMPVKDPNNQQPSPKSKSKRSLDSSPASSGQDKKLAKTKKEELKVSVSSVRPKGKPGTDEKSSGSHTRLKTTSKLETKDGMLKNNKKKPLNCKYCHKVFTTEVGLKLHIFWHKKCSKCLKTFEYPSFLRQHMKHCHGGKGEKNSGDSTEEKQTDNQQKVGSVKLHSCKHCSQKFDTKLLLSKHVKKNHEDEASEDEERNGDLSWRASMDKREKGKGQEAKAKTDSKGQEAKAKTDSKGQEAKAKTDSKPWKCHVCKKFLSTKIVLKEHLRIHTGEKPVVCPDCGTRFRCHPHLCRHRKLGHCSAMKGEVGKKPKVAATTGTEKLRCKECDRMFTTNDKLTNHRRVVHRKTLISCKICGRGFSYVGRLTQHYERAHP